MSAGPEVEVKVLLDELARRGIRIMREPGDKLKLSGNGKPPAGLLETLRAVKPQVVEALRRQARPAEPARSAGCPGPERCAGCYSIGVVDGKERFIHPPKASRDWVEWLKRWEPKNAVVQ